MRHPRSLAAVTRRALTLTVVMFCIGAWMAPAANAQLIGDIVDEVVGGDGGSSSSGGDPDGSTGDSSGGGSTAPDDGGGSNGGLVGGVIDGLDGKDDGESEGSEGGGGGLIGGVIDAIDKTGDKTVETVDEVTGGTLSGVGQTITDTTGDTVKKVKKSLSGTSGKKKTTDRPKSGTTTPPVRDTWDVLGESFMRTNAEPNAAGSGNSQTSSNTNLITPVVSVDDSIVAQIARVAAEAVEQAAFPIALLMLVVGFLAVQNRIDRKDPKLALAPVDSEHDLLSFT